MMPFAHERPKRNALLCADVCKMCRRAAFAVFCVLASVSTRSSPTNSAIQRSSLEMLIQSAAEAGPNLTSRFELGNSSSGKSIEIQVAGEGSVECCGASSRVECVASFRNPTGGVLKLPALPSSVHGVFFLQGEFDLRNIGECGNVRWLFADFTDYDPDLQSLCKCFPSVESMVLTGLRINEFDADMGQLLHMQSLKRLELSCVVGKGMTGGDLTCRLLTGLPQLERLYVQASCSLGSAGERCLAGLKCHYFEMSDSLANGDGVVVLRDWGDCNDITIRMYSPALCFAQLRPPPIKEMVANEKLLLLKIDTHNVVPSGETSIIDDGQLLYHIRIDKSEERIGQGAKRYPIRPPRD